MHNRYQKHKRLNQGRSLPIKLLILKAALLQAPTVNGGEDPLSKGPSRYKIVRNVIGQIEIRTSKDLANLHHQDVDIYKGNGSLPFMEGTESGSNSIPLFPLSLKWKKLVKASANIGLALRNILKFKEQRAITIIRRKKMKRTSLYMLLVMVLFLLTNCSSKDAKESMLQFEGNSFILKIDRRSENPSVKYPNDQLLENDYEALVNGPSYELSFDEDKQAFLIVTLDVSGVLVANEESIKIYELDSGLFAGGRFIIWISDDTIEAEYTVYGSGVPILTSERGYLTVKE